MFPSFYHETIYLKLKAMASKCVIQVISPTRQDWFLRMGYELFAKCLAGDAWVENFRRKYQV